MLLIEGRHIKSNKGKAVLSKKTYMWRIFKKTDFKLNRKMQTGDIAVVISKSSTNKTFPAPVVITNVIRVSDDTVNDNQKLPKDIDVVLKVLPATEKSAMLINS